MFDFQAIPWRRRISDEEWNRIFGKKEGKDEQKEQDKQVAEEAKDGR
jgi:hypothetical protein